MSDNRFINLMFAFLRSAIGKLIYTILRLIILIFVFRQLVLSLIYFRELMQAKRVWQEMAEKFKWLDKQR